MGPVATSKSSVQNKGSLIVRERTRVASATRLRHFCSVFAVLVAAALPALGQVPPYWNNGSPNNVNNATVGSTIPPAAWPAESAWVKYSWGTTYPDLTDTQKHPIRDQRVQDPSNGGTTPQNYVNVSSGCPDQILPSI